MLEVLIRAFLVVVPQSTARNTNSDTVTSLHWRKPHWLTAVTIGMLDKNFMQSSMRLHILQIKADVRHLSMVMAMLGE